MRASPTRLAPVLAAVALLAAPSAPQRTALELGDLGPWFGDSIAFVDDLDHDGRPELLASNPRTASGAGRAFLVSSLDGRVLWQFDRAPLSTPEFGTAVAGSKLEPNGGMRVAVGDPAWRAAGDAPTGLPRGRVLVYHLTTLQNIGVLSVLEHRGRPGDSLGRKLSRSADIDRDGIDDFVAPSLGDNAAYVIPGGPRTLLRVDHAFARGSYDVAAFGDLDRDYVPDVAVAPLSGAARILRASDGVILRIVPVPAPPFQTTTGHYHRIVPAGDLDGDGIEDLLGIARYFGTDRTAQAVVAASGADGSHLHVIWDDAVQNVAGVGDWNGDGHNDFAHSAHGRIRIVSGLGGVLHRIDDPRIYFALEAGGDVDGDGVLDLAVGLNGPRGVRVYTAEHRPCVPVPSQLIGWWPFDEGSGSTTGERTFGWTASLAPQTNWLNGYVRRSIELTTPSRAWSYRSLNGLDPYRVGEDDFSVMAWVRIANGNVLARRTGLGGDAPSWELRIVASRLELRWDHPGGSAIARSIRPVTQLGRWHHVAVVVDRDTPSGSRFYLDGLEVGQFDATGLRDALPPLGETGSITTEVGSGYTGGLDEIMLVRRAMTADEIRAVHTAGSIGLCEPRPRAPGSMVAYWPLDEGRSRYALDPFGNRGAFSGPTSAIAGAARGGRRLLNGSFVEVPHAEPFAGHVGGDLDLAGETFSISAWTIVNDNPNLEVFEQTLAQKLDAQGTGYWLGLDYNYGALLTLRLRAADGRSVEFQSSAEVGAPPQWSHLAVTVDRRNPTGGVFYADGQVVGRFDPTGIDFEFTNTAPLRLGGHAYSPGGGHALDELCLFTEALSAAQIGVLHGARDGLQVRARTVPVGTGCSVGMAPLTLDRTAPVLGEVSPFTVTGPAGSLVHLFMSGLTRSHVQVPGSPCWLYLNLDNLWIHGAGTIGADGTWRLPSMTELVPQWEGLRLRAQGIVFPTAGGWGTTNGIEMTLGY